VIGAPLRVPSVFTGSLCDVVRPSPRLLDAIGTVARIGLAAVWIVSGAIKVSDLNQTYVAVQAYQLLPPGAVSPVAGALPFVELALGALLLAGLGTRLAAAVSALALIGFIVAVSSSWARGLTIDCGCFGGGGQVAAGETEYPQEIARDIGFLALAAWLLCRPRSFASLDRWLTRRDSDTGAGEDVPDEPVAELRKD
jgi:uncharacterized membrane protein YphA (DoxX/SURF4 family)